jgi:biopolymer transport protein TolQ
VTGSPPLFAVAGSFDTGLLDLIYTSSLIVQFVFLILMAFSVLSWAIIFRKLVLFRKVERQSYDFLKIFHESSKLSDIYKSSDAYKNSPLTGIFFAGYSELNAQLTAKPAPAGETAPSLQIKSIANVERTLRKASTVELTSLEKSLSWLATTGSVTPFIGLFGTVVGIIHAFQGLGQLETTSIQAVAPGIAEALITTAVGLFAAIPAVIFYNHFLSRIKHMASLLDDFATEFINLVERNFT